MALRGGVTSKTLTLFDAFIGVGVSAQGSAKTLGGKYLIMSLKAMIDALVDVCVSYQGADMALSGESISILYYFLYIDRLGCVGSRG